MGDGKRTSERGAAERFPRLRRGRSLLPQELVDEYQRSRIVAAVADVVHENGAVELTARNVIKTAGVSPATFYSYFDNRNVCFEYACEAAFEWLFEPVRAAYETGTGWHDSFRRAVEAFVNAAREEPRVAALCLLYSQARESEARCWHAEAVDVFARFLGEAPRCREAPTSPLVGQLAAGAIITAVSMRLGNGSFDDDEDLAAELLRAVSAPLGIEEPPVHEVTPRAVPAPAPLAAG